MGTCLRLPLVLLVYTAACGCGPHWVGDTLAAKKAAIQQLIPLGTSRDQARRTMERAGYTVTSMTNARFSEEGVVHKGIDFLYCDCSEQTYLIIERRWQVGIVYTGDSVSDILVSRSLTGP
jgi:hypothetical protein